MALGPNKGGSYLMKYGWIIALLVAMCALGIGIWLGR
jgi:hypothetical protein